jgi:hypothetical protein
MSTRPFRVRGASMACPQACRPRARAPTLEAGLSSVKTNCLTCHQVESFAGGRVEGNLGFIARAMLEGQFVKSTLEPSGVTPNTGCLRFDESREDQRCAIVQSIYEAQVPAIWRFNDSLWPTAPSHRRECCCSTSSRVPDRHPRPMKPASSRGTDRRETPERRRLFRFASRQEARSALFAARKAAGESPKSILGKGMTPVGRTVGMGGERAYRRRLGKDRSRHHARQS